MCSFVKGSSRLRRMHRTQSQEVCTAVRMAVSADYLRSGESAANKRVASLRDLRCNAQQMASKINARLKQ